MADDPRNFETLMAKWIAIQRAGSYLTKRVANDMAKALYAVLGEVTLDATPAAVIASMNTALKGASTAMYDDMAKQLAKIAQPIINSAWKEAVDIGAAKGKPPTATPTKVKGIMKNSVLPATNSTVKDLYDATIDGYNRKVSNVVRTAYAEGGTVSATKKQIRGITSQAVRQLDTVARTAVNKVANESKMLAFEKAKGIDRVLWISVLDHRTSPFCMAADGKVFPVDSAPYPPAHPRCRSTTVGLRKGESATTVQKEIQPRTAVEPKSVDKLEKQGTKTKTGKPRKPSVTDRSPLKRVDTRSISYETWLKKQPALYQDQILGKNAAKRFRKGDGLLNVLEDSRSSINFDALSEAL